MTLAPLYPLFRTADVYQALIDIEYQAMISKDGIALSTGPRMPFLSLGLYAGAPRKCNSTPRKQSMPYRGPQGSVSLSSTTSLVGMLIVSLYLGAPPRHLKSAGPLSISS